MNCTCPGCKNLIFIDVKESLIQICDFNSLCEYCGVMLILTPSGLYTEDQYTNGVN